MSRKNRKKRRIEVADADQTQRYGGSGDGAAPASPAPEPAETAADAGETADELETLRGLVAELKDQLLRARAEQQNLAKRKAGELSEAVRYANASLIKELLASVDNFDRLEEQSAGADVETVRQGARLIRDELVKVLERQGLQTIDALDKPFDPRCHEAMLQQSAPDKEPGTVIQVYQTGYMIGERVLRPAKVVVSAAANKDGEEGVPESAGEAECGAGTADCVREER